MAAILHNPLWRMRAAAPTPQQLRECVFFLLFTREPYTIRYCVLEWVYHTDKEV